MPLILWNEQQLKESAEQEKKGDDKRQDLKRSKESLPSLVSSAALSTSICLHWHGANLVYWPYSKTNSPQTQYEKQFDYNSIMKAQSGRK